MHPTEITCVQPLCGHVTRNWYRIDVQTALRLENVAPGETCDVCFEKITARETREIVHPPPQHFVLLGAR